MINQKMDPFPGPAPIPEDRMQKFRRKDKIEKVVTLVSCHIFNILLFHWNNILLKKNQLLPGASRCIFCFSLQPDRKRHKLNKMLTHSEEASEMAQTQAARFDLLLPEEAG